MKSLRSCKISRRRASAFVTTAIATAIALCFPMFPSIQGFVQVLGKDVGMLPGIALAAEIPSSVLPNTASLPAATNTGSPGDVGGNTSERTFLSPGASAPVSVLRDLNDAEWRFPIAGRWNLILFWSLFCHSCLEEIPIVASEADVLSKAGIESFFIALDTSRMKKGLENYVQKRNLKIRVLLEEIASGGYLAADGWGVKTTPSVFLTDQTGKIVFSREGPFDLDELWAAVRGATSLPASSTSPCP
ncbi:MAG: redoxin domain-containing protein [Candidatus Riflebacteria bacterium]|nr:redoxin domain-containing protein [Candidatus Riflebacteria bacterium]